MEQKNYLGRSNKGFGHSTVGKSSEKEGKTVHLVPKDTTFCLCRQSKIQKSYSAESKYMLQNTNFKCYLWPRHST